MAVRGSFAAGLLAGICLAATPAAYAQSDKWDKPMSLGRGPAVETQISPRAGAVASPADKCGKWRRVADRLGETYAGIRLRQSVVARTCAFADEAPVENQVWSWPWAREEISAELPPRLHGKFAGWTIRCGAAGTRERCALIHEMDMNASQSTGTDERVRLITHFVIDEIGGQERVLWRVFVERAEPHWFDGSVASTGGQASDLVRTQVGAAIISKRFDGCGRYGCLMEAEMGASARVATRLWEGGDLQIEVRPVPGLVLSQIAPAAGFRQGLRELSTLKRREHRVLAGK
jgi:hypothetical protein